ncbi:MauE/DoxX family redox-associated membrane protein [Microbacterium thalassium]|uniref:Methylamine utilisation protein MauE domain-containing protein n=1 Tax=Microbacterium thalassium TaxID=362649 RepID=A0A7X0KTA5_9MICO|nr:MauE/DoxX family redox-associated membrane protein [Microbacterium thalassium]MBB6389882.1 hypothetical protein [Microbacterium thalassium]GLK24569.1 hypothetical protein GCM10017607_18870 [Microbacterium thalassium]
MPGPLSIALPLVLAAVLIASAIAKLRHPDDVAGWAELGVPAVFQRAFLVRLHPWGELVLAAALVLLGGVLGAFAALAAAALMAAYLWLIVRAYRRAGDASCACFGERSTVTLATVVRNAWLLLIAAASVAVIWSNPIFGGAVTALGGEDWLWLIAVAVAAATAILVVWSDAAGRTETPIAAPEPARAGGEDDLEYIRIRTPAVPVTLADGTVENLRTLASRKPILVLAVSPVCGSCTPVIEKASDWRPILPEVDIRMLSELPPGNHAATDHSEPQSLHDEGGYLRQSIGDWGTPTALLLGADGLLAGGPVTGFTAIEEFIGDVYENLHGSRPVMPAAVDSDVR